MIKKYVHLTLVFYINPIFILAKHVFLNKLKFVQIDKRDVGVLTGKSSGPARGCLHFTLSRNHSKRYESICSPSS